MQRFKSIILPMQGHNKSELHWLYNTRYTKIEDEEEPPLIFSYSKLKFWFSGTSYRSSEKLLLYVQIPTDTMGDITQFDTIPCETYLLRLISPMIDELSRSYLNTDKNVREKAQFEAQYAGEYMVRRSGIQYNVNEKAYVVRINFNVPLVNALSVNAKSAIRAIKDILMHIEKALYDFDRGELELFVNTHANQQEIRKYISEHGLCAFVANGSILPRENGTSEPMKNATPFVAPKELEVTIPLFDSTYMVGMGIPKGVTVITGGGYSGKSTLLNAIEMGIYDHIPGDGREYVLTDQSALKIYAEDARPVSNLDISPFFKFLPNTASLDNFSTLHASGSVSQAANIIEAICGKCSLLLIDEDKSATNFMIRDKIMRLIVTSEPIIPFTDRVRELHQNKNVSTILVIGGSSEYLSYADNVILMDDYLPRVITKDVQGFDLPKVTHCEDLANWTASRRLMPLKTSNPFLLFQSVQTENEKKIILDKFSADITHLTALVSGSQLNTLACVMQRLLTDVDINKSELLDKIESHTKNMLSNNDTSSLDPQTAQRFYEAIRPIDAFCCVNRMRGLVFNSDGGDAQ